MFRVFCWLNVTFKSTLPPILLMLISFIHTLHDAALNLFCIWDTLIFWLFKPFNFKRRVSSHFVTKTTTCCICMWKLSFSKYGNTHLISELYYKIGRRFIFRKIIMFSVPLGSSSRQFHPYSKNKIPFALLSLLPTSSHLFIFRII
jgi:hypothetical protein